MGWRNWLGLKASSASKDQGPEEIPDLINIPITDVIDLHSFPPRQIKAIVEEYLAQACALEYKYVRIIHGRGTGFQRNVVRDLLAGSPHVIIFYDAPPEAGGWGATIAELAIENHASK